MAPPRRSSRLKDRAARQETTAALKADKVMKSEQTQTTPPSRNENAKIEGTSSKSRNETPVSETSMSKYQHHLARISGQNTHIIVQSKKR